MNEIVEKYCRVTGTEPGEIINRKKDRRTVTKRNAFIYLTWLHRKPTITFSNPKRRVMSEIGKDFNLARNTVHESLDNFERQLEQYPDTRRLLEEIKMHLS